MDFDFSFVFRDKLRYAHAYIDYKEKPYFIFTIILDSELVEEFSQEVTIKTDFNKVLPKADDIVKGMVELRQAMFDVIKESEPFKQLKAKVANLNLSDPT
jgi:hypothetical protein